MRVMSAISFWHMKFPCRLIDFCAVAKAKSLLLPAETGAEISPQRLASTFNVVFFIFPEIIPKVVCNKWSRVILKLVARDTIWQILCPLLANSNSRLQAASAW